MSPPIRALLLDLDDTLAATGHLAGLRQNPSPALGEAVWGLEAYSGLRHTLQSLQKTIPLGVVTASSRRYAERVLRQILPGVSWRVVVTGSDVPGRAKPYPDGLALALAGLGSPDPQSVAYVGDDPNDVEAAYHARVRPVLALWGRLKTPGQVFDPFSAGDIGAFAASLRVPADTILWRPDELVRYCAEPDAFLPALESGAEEIRALPFRKTCGTEVATGLALGRYFVGGGVTSQLYRSHPLSRTIKEKDDGAGPFHAPERWVEAVGAMAGHYATAYGVDRVTVVPARKGRDGRLERLLARVRSEQPLGTALCVPDLLGFDDGAAPAKELGLADRWRRAERNLHVRADVRGRRVLVIDDVVTTGATLLVARRKLLREGADEVRVLALAQAVTGFGWVDPAEVKACPVCGKALRRQVNRATGEIFWGCTGYRKQDRSGCRYTESEKMAA